LLVAQGFGKLADRILVHTLLVKALSLLGVTLKKAWLHSIRLDPRKSLRCSQINLGAPKLQIAPGALQLRSGAAVHQEYVVQFTSALSAAI